MQMKTILQLKDVSLSYHTDTEEVTALKQINMSVSEREFVAFVGPSGCGKTTLLSLMNGLLLPSKGEVLINSQPFSGISNETAYMLQRDCLFAWRTIWQNVILPLEIKNNKTPERLAFLENLIQKYGLHEFRDRYPNQLSGGMRQRVALIRTLAQNPSILLLDEPFSALDYQTRLKVCDDVYSIITEQNKSAVLVTHDIAEAISMADRVFVLTKRPGQIKKVVKPNLKEYGSPLKRREHPDFRLVFDAIWKEMQFDETN